ncbi:MAG: DUF2147 domain-containing protein [Chitinophagales bacterium]|jgi:uncharacterized protein (DUF2147 family)|nr:DUF2147 domain-containing protein [Chitinophagales bacterium]
MKYFLFFIISFFVSFTCNAQTKSNLEGYWLSENQKQKLFVFQEPKSKQYFGKIVWMYEDDQENGRVLLDVNNPDENLRTRRVTGIILLKNFKQTGDSTFKGKIYDPISGKDYRCSIELLGNNKAKVRGYIIHPILGRTDIATKVTK